MRKLLYIIISLLLMVTFSSCTKKEGHGVAYMSVSDFIKMENRAQIKSIRVDISSENRGDDMSKDSVPVSVSIKDSVLILTTSADTIRLPENCANMFKDCVNLEFVDWRHF
ncbi:MAG TPA: hypothetical protein PLB70_11030, partial [Paludibacteraceae bacterium]|nr:hypothetical protein [Paludibacteraceae bacterium]